MLENWTWVPIAHPTYAAIYADMKERLSVYATNSDEYYGPYLTVWSAGDAPIIKSECRGKGTDDEKWSYFIASHKELSD